MRMSFSREDIRRLKNASEGRDRVTTALAETLAKLADTISKGCEAGDAVTVNDMTYHIKEITTKVSAYKYLCVSESDLHQEDREYREYVLEFADYYPKESTFLMNDFNVPISIPPREVILHFAENTKEILSEFAKLQDQKKDRAKKALSTVEEAN